MKFYLLTLFLAFSLSIKSYAETCTGIEACSNLYTQLSGKKVFLDKKITTDMTLAVSEADLTKENAKKAYNLFLNKNAVNLFGNQVIPSRNNEFLSAPIHLVTKDNMPQVFSPDGLINYVYISKKKTSNLVKPYIRRMLSKGGKSINKIVEYGENKIIVVSDKAGAAEKIMKAIMSLDE